VTLILTRLILALVLFAGGLALRSLASVERSFADASRLTATLSPNAVGAYEDLEASLGRLGRLPRLGSVLVANAREARMVADYTEGSFVRLAAMDDHQGTPDSLSGEHLFVAANAALRANMQTRARPEAAMRNFDAIAKRYADVLEREPGHVDAAYNHEYVLRLRSRVARTNRTPALDPPARRKGDLPVGPTIHGVPGGPPRGVKFGEFQLLIPLTPEEADFPDDQRRTRRNKG
jgi:hypothetical protein